jgi:SOS-response transcriptional repressor LexA
MSATPSRSPRTIPIRVVADDDSCGGGESFALMVLGDSMTPEFDHGDIVIIEPDGHAGDGAYVLAWQAEEWIFRQLRRTDRGWCLHALNPAYPALELTDRSAVRGVIIQKSRPGRRRATRRYVD